MVHRCDVAKMFPDDIVKSMALPRDLGESEVSSGSAVTTTRWTFFRLKQRLGPQEILLEVISDQAKIE